MVFIRPLLKRRLYASIDAEARAPPSFRKKENEIDYLLIFSGLSITFFLLRKENLLFKKHESYNHGKR
jgi:hypothetical protein